MILGGEKIDENALGHIKAKKNFVEPNGFKRNFKQMSGALCTYDAICFSIEKTMDSIRI